MPNIDTLSIQFNANGTEKAIKNIRSMGYAVRNLAQSVKSIDTNKLTTFTSSMETLKRSVPTDAQTNRMVAFANAVKDLSAVIGSANISGFSKDMSNLGEAVQTFKKSSVNSIQNAVTAMQNLGTQAQTTANVISNAVPKKSAPISGGDNKATLEKTTEIIASLDKVQVKAKGVQGVLSKMGIYVPTKGFKELEKSAEKIRQKYEEVRATLQKGLSEGRIESGGTEYKKKMAELDGLRNKYDELIQKQRELALEGKGFSLNPNIQKAYSGISQTVSGVKQTFGGIASAVGTANKHINSFISKLRSLGSHSKSVKRDTTSLSDATKKLANEFFRVSKMLKLMITRMALRKVIAEVGNGFKSLAIHSEEFNNSVSGMMNASMKLGYSFASMISPLINAFAPAIIYVIELLTKLVNIINQVFSALSGATTWNKSKDFSENWADNIESANKSAKELKKTVLGFDELNQLQENKSSGGDSAKNIKDMFETMPIESKWKSLADHIKKIARDLFAPIKKAWENVGDFVKKSWKYALDEVLKLGQSIARDFWKVWNQKATQQIFENILKIIGYIGLAVGNLAKRFREAWDFNNTGYKILVHIRDIILTITEHFKNMAKATADWADSLDFKPLLTSVEKWLDSLKKPIDAIFGILEDFYTEVVLKFTKWVIESGLPKLVDVFKRFNDEVKWDNLRNNLAELWKHLEPFMETIGEGLIIFIERVTTALAKFINGDTFANFLDQLGKWMDTVTPEDVADAIEKLVLAIAGLKVAGVVISALSGFASVMGTIVTIGKGISTAASGISTLATAISGLGIGAGGAIGVVAALVIEIYSLVESFGGIDGTIKRLKESSDKLLEVFRKFADDLQLSKSIENLQKSFEGLKKELGNMKDLWNIILNALGTVVSFIGTRVITIINTFTRVLSDAIDFLKGWFEMIGGVAEILTGVFTLNADKIKEGAKRLWDGITDIFKSAITALAHIILGLIDLIVQPFKTIKYMLVGDPIVIDMWNDIKKVFQTSIKAVVEFVTGFKNSVVTLFNSLNISVGDILNAVSAKFNELKTKIAEVKDKISEIVQKLKDNIATHFENIKTGLENFKKIWELNLDAAKLAAEEFMNKIKTFFSKSNWTFDGVKEGLKSTFESAKEGIKGVWNGIAEKLNGEYEIGEGKLKINLPTFATGGFPEDGLFLASHHELVGHFSNGKTAVANNGQIIAGIEAGVYNAMSQVMSQSGGSNQYIANEIIVDGDVIARTVSKAQDRQSRRYSPAY